MATDEQMQYYRRTVALAVVSTVVITASFMGIFAFLEGEVGGLTGRFHWYLLATAAVFLGSVIFLEGQGMDGRDILALGAVFSVAGLILVVLTAEGIRLAFSRPGDLWDAQLVPYFLAAGMFGAGIGYWGIKHWREFTGQQGRPDQL